MQAASRGFTPENFSLHFHSFKGRFGCGIPEVADFSAPVFTAVDAIVVYFQSTVIFQAVGCEFDSRLPLHKFIGSWTERFEGEISTLQNAPLADFNPSNH
jgi:hypothetical protein